MKFGDKLVLLRKKKGLSQEELASMLNVSRQSVSKWESNNTYPETDKIVQICNIFDCKMDDLINDKIGDVEQVMRKNKNNLSMVFDSLLEFITKSINMFSSMKILSILKCIIELGVLSLILFIVSLVISELSTSIIMKLFVFLSGDFYWSIYNMFEGIIQFGLICISLIVLVHVFKIRYLDYYDKALSEKDESYAEKEQFEVKKDETKKIEKIRFKLNNEPKIIIRDKHTTFAFLSTLSKIVVGIFKGFVAICSCAFAGVLVALVALFVISIFFTKFSILFLGVDISLFSAIIVCILIIVCLFNYVLDKKYIFKYSIYIVISSVILFGIGVGIASIGVTDFKFIDNMEGIAGEYISKNKVIEYNDNLVINTYDVSTFTITIDNSMKNNIKVIGTNQEMYFNGVRGFVDRNYGMEEYYFHNSTSLSFDKLISMIFRDLENNVFRDYYVENGTIEFVCSEDVANKLINNAKKIYLVDYEKTNKGYKIKGYDRKIYLDYNCEMEYDARNGKYSYDDSCICQQEVRMSQNGEIIDFDCKKSE